MTKTLTSAATMKVAVATTERTESRPSSHQGNKGAGQHQKNRPANISDVRSFGEHKKRVRSKRAALEME